jgi:hypothetical protein
VDVAEEEDGVAKVSTHGYFFNLIKFTQQVLGVGSWEDAGLSVVLRVMLILFICIQNMCTPTALNLN